MKTLVLAPLAALLSLGAAAHATTFQFTATISSENLNFEDVTGQGLTLLRAGDTVTGTFDYVPAAPVAKTVTNVGYRDVILNSVLSVYRQGSLLLSLTQHPAFFSNGNALEQSFVSIRNGDPTGRRDVIDLEVGGLTGFDPDDPFKLVSPITISPSNDNIIAPSWDFSFAEQCSSGSTATNDCVSDDISRDYYDGTQSVFDLEKAFHFNSYNQFYITLPRKGSPGQFDGDFEYELGSVDSLRAIPEPTNWAMMIAGFGLVGAALRRRTCLTDGAADELRDVRLISRESLGSAHQPTVTSSNP